MFVHYCETTMGIEVRNTAVHSYSTSSNEDEKFKFASLTKHIHTLVQLKGPCRENQSPLFQVQPKNSTREHIFLAQITQG